MDATGDFVITWSSFGQDGSSYGVYARRYLAGGAAATGEFQVNQYTTSSQFGSAVAMDAQGNFTIAWQSYGQDGSKYGIYARRYGAAANPLGNEFQVNEFTTGNQIDPNVAVDAAGDVVVTWSSQAQDGSGYGVYARQYDPSGQPLTDEIQVNTVTANSQLHSSVAMDAGGDFTIAYQSYGQDTDNYGIFARRFSRAAVAQGNEFQVNQYVHSAQTNPAVAMNAQGDFAVAWTSNGQDGSGLGVFARRFERTAVIQSVQVVGASQPIVPNQRLAGPIPAGGSLVVQFSHAMDPTSTQALSHWQLLLNGVNVSSRISAVTYNAATRQATISFNTALGDGNYLLSALSAGIFDSNGRALDGTFTGTTGGTYSLPFTVLAPVSLPQYAVDTTAFGQHLTDPYGNSVAVDAQGNSTVVWVGTVNGGYGIFARRYSADGTPLTGEVQVNTDTAPFQGTPTVASDARGDVVIAWESQVSGGGFQIIARLWPAGGAFATLPFQVNVAANSATNPAVAMDTFGDFVVAWDSAGGDGSGSGVFARLYAAGGQSLTGEFQVNQTTADNQAHPAVAMDQAGDFVIAWNSYGQDRSGYGVFARRYQPTGSPAGGEFQVNTFTTGNQQLPSVAMDAAGEFVIAWQSDGQASPSSGSDIFAMRFAADGTPRDTQEFQVNQFITSQQTLARVSMDAQGDFVVSWQSYGQDGNTAGYGVYTRRYRADGTALTGETQANQFTTASQSFAGVSMDAAGDFVVAWSSQYPSGTGSAVFARRYAALPTGFAYNPATQTLTMTATGTQNHGFTFTQSTTADFSGVPHSLYTFTLDGNRQTISDLGLTHVNVTAPGTGNNAALATNDTYLGGDGMIHETQENLILGGGSMQMQKLDSGGNAFTFLQLVGFHSISATGGPTDTGLITGTAGVQNTFVSAGGYAYMNSGSAFYYINGTRYVYGFAANTGDIAYHYDGSGPSAVVMSGVAYSFMIGTDNGRSFFNEAVGFKTSYAFAQHPDVDTAFFYDSPATDIFVGNTTNSYLYSDNPDGTFAEFDFVQGFAQVNAYSFVDPGIDYAYVFDTTVNHTTGFTRLA
jgi:hypothetical protein